MYRTSQGERILKGAEARLFRYGLARAIEELTMMPDDAEVGINSFDRMTVGQRLTGLYLTASALLDEQAPILPLTQSIEASVAAVYQVIATDAIVEAETPELDSVSARAMIVDAMREADCDEVPDPRCTDAVEWEYCVDFLKDLIQFDDDFEDFDDLTDQAPEIKAAFGSWLGIDSAYFLHGFGDSSFSRETSSYCHDLLRLTADHSARLPFQATTTAMARLTRTAMGTRRLMKPTSSCGEPTRADARQCRSVGLPEPALRPCERIS
jgi:hypothetical protein